MAEASPSPAGGPEQAGLPATLVRSTWRTTAVLVALQVAAVAAHLYLDSALSGVLVLPALLLPPMLALTGHIQGRSLLRPSPHATAGMQDRAGFHSGVLLPPVAVALFGSLLIAAVHMLQEAPTAVLLGDVVRGIALAAALTLFSFSCYALGYRAGKSGSDVFAALLFPATVFAVSLLSYGFAPEAALPVLLNPAAPALLPLTSGGSAGPMAAGLEELLAWFHFFDIGRYSSLLFLPALVQGGIALILSTDFRSHPDSAQLSDFRLPGALLLGAFLANLYHATLTEGWLPLFDFPALPLSPYPVSVIALALLTWTVVLLTASSEHEQGHPLPPVRPTRMLYPALTGTLFLLPATVLFETSLGEVAWASGVLLLLGAGFAGLVRTRIRTLTVLTAVGTGGLAWLVLHGGF